MYSCPEAPPEAFPPISHKHDQPKEIRVRFARAEDWNGIKVGIQDIKIFPKILTLKIDALNGL